MIGIAATTIAIVTTVIGTITTGTIKTNATELRRPFLGRGIFRSRAFLFLLQGRQ
jgi:hypothetical protein